LLPTAEVRVNKFTQAEELNLSASIAEGDFAGRRVFWTYPDPSSVSKNGKPFTWSAQAMKKLEISLGLDAFEGESLVDFFNRAANSNSNRFGAALIPETRKDTVEGSETYGEYIPYVRPGETEPRAVFSIFSVKAAA
jgi:hypothetical protein